MNTLFFWLLVMLGPSMAVLIWFFRYSGAADGDGLPDEPEGGAQR
jgi:hypothetical protein